MGSEMEIGIVGVQGNSDFTMFADGENIGEFHLGNEALLGNGCEFIAEKEQRKRGGIWIERKIVKNKQEVMIKPF